MLKIDLQLKPYKIKKVQDLKTKHKNVRLGRVRALKVLHVNGYLPYIVLSDEDPAVEGPVQR